MIQKSFVMMKPDAVQRRLMGKILSRFEEKGLQIVAVKLMQIDEDLAKRIQQRIAKKLYKLHNEGLSEISTATIRAEVSSHLLYEKEFQGNQKRRHVQGCSSTGDHRRMHGFV